MGSQASISFHLNKKDIEMLWPIYAELTGSGRKKKHKAHILNRTAMVFISACWESYIEDVCIEAFDFLLKNVQDPNLIPAKVQVLALRELRDDKDERKIWKLAGSGWKTVLKNHEVRIREKWVKHFNTPKSEQVSNLFSELLGIKDIKSQWTWDDMTSETACEKLDRFISIRGNIAHRVKHQDRVHKSWAKEFLLHVTRLVDKTDEILNRHLFKITATNPW